MDRDRPAGWTLYAELCSPSNRCSFLKPFVADLRLLLPIAQFFQSHHCIAVCRSGRRLLSSSMHGDSVPASASSFVLAEAASCMAAST